ncbi:MAG: hypothetical protein R3C25_08180 [Hyphomonadaceae bacterium]
MRNLIGAALVVLAACHPSPEGGAGDGQTQNAGPAIPGPRTCFWSRGPHSADPYINVAYPDANVFYWAAVFTVPEGARLELRGQYPHSRYMSLISYDEAGRPVESLADYLIAPGDPGQRLGQARPQRWARLISDAEAAEGDAVNPFVPGNRRDSEARDYRVEVVDAPADAARTIGERNAATSAGNVLHAPHYGAGQQVVLYRIYLPDQSRAPDGGVALPAPQLTMADGSVLEGADACQALHTGQRLAIAPDATGITPDAYRALISQPGRPDTWPAQNPARWFIQLDRESLLGIYTGHINENARRSEGGFYPNLDNNYIRTIVNRKHGRVFLIRGRAPTTPHTYGGDEVMGDGELRYWSVCSNQGFANTRVNDCLFDEEIPLDENGFYTIAVSREEDRPRNARPECGLAWLPMAPDGDGLFDPDVTVVQFRHMLTAPDFAHSIQRVERQDQLETTMSAYMPQTRYLMPSQVEAFFPCFAGLSENGG